MGSKLLQMSICLSLGAATLFLGVPVNAADCASAFAEDNRVKPEAGPYRLEDKGEVRLNQNGTWLLARTFTSKSEVIPPASLRVTHSASHVKIPEMVIVDGREGWRRTDQDSPWVLMSASELDERLRDSFGSYFSTEGMTGLTCKEDALFVGANRRVYQYQLPASSQLFKETEAMVVFDRSRRIPLAASILRKGENIAVHISSTMVFDSTIRIAAPVAGKLNPQD